MFRRLRGRLDHMEGDADRTMQLARDLIADLQDGFGVSIEIDAKAAQTIMGLLMGRAGTLPIRVKIDPTVDSGGE